MTSIILQRRHPLAVAVGARFYLGILILSGGWLTPGVAGQTAQAPSPVGAVSTSSSTLPGHDHSLPAKPAHPLHTLRLMAMREPTTIAVPDLELINQDGRKVKLYGLMKDKMVVLNFFYTTCQAICPTTGLWLSKLQETLGDRLGKDVVIVSISLDPEVDTPAKIKRWGSLWKRKPGWTLLTSKNKAVDQLSQEFLAGELRGMHSPNVFVGDGVRNPIGWINVDILDESQILLYYFGKKKADDAVH
jgi:hypothetical protein